MIRDNRCRTTKSASSSAETGTLISRILKRDAHLSLEQADQLVPCLHLTKDEGRFFLLLVQYERAGTSSLQKRYREDLDEILEKRKLLRNRVDIKEALPEEVRIKYYSSWHFAAVHMAITIERLSTFASLADHFQIPSDQLQEVLDFLEKSQLIEKLNSSYIVGKKRIFLGSDSDLISKHHTNWRIRAIDAFDHKDEKNIHLSTVLTMSKKDLESVREELLGSITRARETVKQSQGEEEICCLNLDLFRVK